jgi:hypothetical protein
MTGKFKREFASEAVVNDPDYLWDRLPFDVFSHIQRTDRANEKGGSRQPPHYGH